MIASTGGRPAHLLALLTSGALLGVGLLNPSPGTAHSILQVLRSNDRNSTDREATAGGYYEGLLNPGEAISADGGRDEVALRLLGKPERWISFHDLYATRYDRADFLQFDLHPEVERPVFDHVFTTNHLGLRDREGYSPTKPSGVFRIALLGSSIDMGWGVRTEETYENRLEDWLNHYARARGIDRRFEVLNFACAAYGPAQRVESYRRKAAGFDPDLVLYSATMLDPRLSQIHVCELLAHRVEPTHDYVRQTISRAGLDAADLALGPNGDLRDKDRVKAKLKSGLWGLSDGAVGLLASECRARGTPLACLIVPRAALSDSPEERAEGVARHRAIASRHAVPVLDLSAAFDDDDLADVELAPWDDHPNAEGHRQLFLSLAEALMGDEELRRLVLEE